MVRIEMHGSGVLTDAITTRLGANNRWAVTRATDATNIAHCDLLIAAFDVPNINALLQINAEAFARSQPYLPVWCEFGEIRVGPLVVAPGPGCLACAETRRMNNEPKAMFYKAALAQAASHPAESLSPGAVAIVVGTVFLFVEDALRGERVGQERFWLLHHETLAATEHRFLPDSRCPVCDQRPLDSPEATVCMASTRPTRTGWRVRDYETDLNALKTTFVDVRAGLITTLGTDITTNLSAPGPARHRIADYHQEDWTAGLTHRFPKSQAIGIIEALERYAGLRARARRTRVFGSYRSLRKDAIDPRSLTLYAPEQYETPGFPCVPFHQDIEMSWVWGRSFREDRPVLVPEQVAYYDIGIQPISERIVVENSNGCAAGGCVEEAVFFGLLETIERDGVLRTWYDRRCVTRFDLSSVTDPSLRQALDRIKDVTRYELHAFDVGQEFGIPTVWLMAVDQEGAGPVSFSASKAHPDAQIAIAGALGELAGAIHYHESQYRIRRPELLRMLDCPDLVREEFDHTLLAGLPEAFNRFTFLFGDDGNRRVIDDTAVPELGYWRSDVAAAARSLIAKIIAAGFDTIVIDQTPPEVAPFELSIVKVLVPGLLPFMIGHHLRRIHASPRLTSNAQIYPHPFP